MARPRAPGRLNQILEAGTGVFIAKGYRLARIEDVAEKAGVAPATVHLYAATKEALFDLVMRRALHDPTVLDEPLPYRAPPSAEFVQRTWHRLLATANFPVLRRLTVAVPIEGAAAELRAVLREGYRWLQHHAQAIALIEQGASEWPELAALFALQFRRDFRQRLTTHIARRTAQGVLRPTADAAVAALVLVETVTSFALRRDKALDPLAVDARTEEVVLDMLTAALLMP